MPGKPKPEELKLSKAPTLPPQKMASTEKPSFDNITSAILATALFRCWNIIIFFAAWSTLWTVLQQRGTIDVAISSTLLTVIGTVLGFVISYRTTSSFERYNEGRRLWSSIVYAARGMARLTWFHIPDLGPPTAADTAAGYTDAERRARSQTEKKAVINLIQAYAVAVKHYLRGEQGVFYDDLYPLVKGLPPYALPAAMSHPQVNPPESEGSGSPISTGHTAAVTPGSSELPMPNTTARQRTMTYPEPLSPSHRDVFNEKGEVHLFPAMMPPKYSIFDVWPFSMLVKYLTKHGRKLEGRKAQKLRAILGRGQGGDIVSHNVPLEITLYLSSYIAALQIRKNVDPSTATQMFTALNVLVDSLTGLERILTTPIPFSYSVHLWIVTWLYCLALPFQTLTPLGWLTIPGTVLASFIFFGFLVAGEEIENPFGYDKNDLNLDHFTNGIIRLELEAITAVPIPDPSVWAFREEASPNPFAGFTKMSVDSHRHGHGDHAVGTE